MKRYFQEESWLCPQLLISSEIHVCIPSWKHTCFLPALPTPHVFLNSTLSLPSSDEALSYFLSQRPCMFGKKGFSGKFGRFLKSLLPYKWKLLLSSLTGKSRGTITTGSSLLVTAPAHLGFTVSRNLCCSFCPFPLPLPPAIILRM